MRGKIRCAKLRKVESLQELTVIELTECLIQTLRAAKVGQGRHRGLGKGEITIESEVSLEGVGVETGIIVHIGESVVEVAHVAVADPTHGQGVGGVQEVDQLDVKVDHLIVGDPSLLGRVKVLNVTIDHRSLRSGIRVLSVTVGHP